MRQLTKEEHRHLLCEARDDYYRRQIGTAKRILEVYEDPRMKNEDAVLVIELATFVIDQAKTLIEQIALVDTLNNEISQLKYLLKQQNIPTNE